MISLNLHNPLDPILADFRAPVRASSQAQAIFSHESNPDPESKFGTRATIELVFIYPQYRGKKISETVVLEVERISRNMGVRVVTLYTVAMSSHYTRYTRIGYREFRERNKMFPLEVILALGWTEDHCWAIFLEKKIG